LQCGEVSGDRCLDFEPACGVSPRAKTFGGPFCGDAVMLSSAAARRSMGALHVQFLALSKLAALGVAAPLLGSC